MPFCPTCKEEYKPEIEVCPECDMKLVPALEEEETPIEDLEIMATVLQEESAYIIQGFLENEGIPCQLENITFHSAPGGGLIKVRLWTRKEDVNRARALVEEHERFNICSSCGHVAQARDTTCDFCGESFEI